MPSIRIAALGAALFLATAPATAQMHAHHTAADTAATGAADTAADGAATRHAMWMRPLGAGWSAMGMAQVFPTLTAGSPWRRETMLQGGAYLTQPAVMVNLAAPGQRLVLRTTLNLESWTQPDGELTFGGWGEGFLDSRHPHTFLHEAMLTANWWDVAGGALSVSAGKGFVPYGTDDPMARPVVKFPTNHHLSQILERFTTNVAWLRGGWGIEGAVFGGSEPEGAHDYRNIESYGDSWAARLSRRFGGFGPGAAWEFTASYAEVQEEHHGVKETTRLGNVGVRHAAAYDFGSLYWLVEGSRSRAPSGDGYSSVLGEIQAGLGASRRHQPYARVEYASRPEYARAGAPGTPGFFRYDHGAHAIGATRWLIATVGYGVALDRGPLSVRPYVELQQHEVRGLRGGVTPESLFGGRGFWSLSTGARIFFGGGPMRMGSYGVLDPMVAAMRPRTPAGPSAPAAAHDGHAGHTP